MSDVTSARAPPRRGKTKQPSNPLLEERKKLEEAERLRRARELDRAQRICKGILKRYPDYVGALHTLGLVLADKREYAQSLPYLVQAAMLNPKDWTTLTALSGVYLRLGARVMAARTLEQALRRKPDDASILTTLGEIYREDREYEAAAETFRRALSLDESLHAAGIGLGDSCTHLGELVEAAAAFEEAVKHYTHSIKVMYSLSQLPGSLVKVDVLSLLDDAVPEETEDREDFDSSYAFTKAASLDKAGRHAAAWECLVAANRRPFLQQRDNHRKDVQLQKVFLEGAIQGPIGVEPGGSDPGGHSQSLFILGPSRSGKTTMERLVGAIDGVKRGYENPIVENSVRQAFQTAGLPTRERIFELPAALDELCRDFYLEELEERAGSARVFTNTMPGHITGVLRLAAVVPHARFIFVKRDLDDICLRIFMKKYLSGNAYAYDIGTIREYVGWYYRMIDVLAERLPHIATVIQYDEMLASPAAAARSAAKLCGLTVPSGPLPELGDDRGCAEPYRELIAGAPSNASNVVVNQHT